MAVNIERVLYNKSLRNINVLRTFISCVVFVGNSFITNRIHEYTEDFRKLLKNVKSTWYLFTFALPNDKIRST